MNKIKKCVRTPVKIQYMKEKINKKKWTLISLSTLAILQFMDFITSGILMNFPKLYSEKNTIFNYLYQFMNPLIVLFIVKMLVLMVIFNTYKTTKEDNKWTILIISGVIIFYSIAMYKHIKFLLFIFG